MEKTSNRFTVRRLAVTGLLSALVFVFSWIQIPIGEVARIHLGNVFCALSGLLFGPLTGGLASGFGSMLFDFTNPLYIAESWITFITKFFIGFLAGLIAHRRVRGQRDVCGAVLAEVLHHEVLHRGAGSGRGADAARDKGRHVPHQRGAGRGSVRAACKSRAARAAQGGHSKRITSADRQKARPGAFRAVLFCPIRKNIANFKKRLFIGARMG